MKLSGITCVFICFNLAGQSAFSDSLSNSFFINRLVGKQFIATSDFLDVAISSLNSLNSLIKKENYRNKISSFNNPTSSELGFNLENEIQNALKPLLAKAKTVSASKFSDVISLLVNNPGKSQLPKSTMGMGTVFTGLLGMVGNLAIQEKKITRQDLDSFSYVIGKYFLQYEKLNQANKNFDDNIENLTLRLKDLEFDIREYILDLVSVLHRNIQRSQLKKYTMEDLLLRYLDKQIVETIFNRSNVGEDNPNPDGDIIYPGDGIKTAKEITYGVQKLFIEYQVIYADNYKEIRSVLLDSKALGKSINMQQVDKSVKDLEELYNDSRNADILNIRITILTERLKVLVATEQIRAAL